MRQKQQDSEKPHFTARQLLAIEALSDPDDTRPQYEIAVALKISEFTLSHWKALPGFMELVNQKLDEKRKRARPDVWKAMVRHAKGRSTQDRKLYLEAVGDIKKESHTIEGPIVVRIEWGPETPWGRKDEENQD